MTKQIISDGKADIFLKVSRPVFVRKQLLRSAITAAKLLKEYEEGTATRERKIMLTENLRKVLTEAKRIEKKISKEKLPKLPEEISQKPIIEKEEKKFRLDEVKKRLSKEKKTEEASELEKLRLELADIEAKLGSL